MLKRIYVQTEGECTWSLERMHDSDLTYYEEDEIKILTQRAVKTLEWMLVSVDFRNQQTGMNKEDSSELKEARALLEELKG